MTKMSKSVNDITGQKFGMLTVKEYAGTNKYQQSIWLCECECGGFKTVKGNSLKNGTTRSCGCLKTINAYRLPYQEASFNHLYKKYISNAKKRGYKFDITKEEFRELTSQPCAYCGKVPSQIDYIEGINGDYTYTGLDRINNDDHYHVDNMVPACCDCNKHKFTMTLSDFLNTDYMKNIREDGFSHSVLFKLARLLNNKNKENN